MMYRLLVIIIALSCNVWASTLSLCENELTMNGPTKAVASYLGTLLDRQVIGDNELVVFIDGLDQGNLVNPISEKSASVKSALLIHREKLERLLRVEALNRESLRDWAFNALKEKNRIKKNRSEAERETRTMIPKTVFHRVPNTQPTIEVMNTHITQRIWVEVMGKNPSEFQTSPDHPVENITLWSALVFANKFSELHNLPPVYDLSQIDFARHNDVEIEEIAARGQLRARGGDIRLNGTSDQNVQDLPGFRLPTSWNMSNLLNDLNRSVIGGFFPGRSTTDLAQYAWFSQPYSVGTHPVGQLAPFVFTTPEGSFELFDLQGNVETWVADGRNEVNRYAESYGGSWADSAIILFNRTGIMRNPNERYIGVGIRLVRSLPK